LKKLVRTCVGLPCVIIATPLIGAFLGVSDTPHRKRTGNQGAKDSWTFYMNYEKQ